MMDTLYLVIMLAEVGVYTALANGKNIKNSNMNQNLKTILLFIPIVMVICLIIISESQ